MFAFSRFALVCLVALAALGAFHAPLRAAEPATGLRLYALDRGSLEIKDMSFFSDTGDYDGQSGKIAISCFLIQHPKGTLMWDTGLSPQFVKSDGAAAQGIHATASVALEEQLQQIGLKPASITYLAFSHLHFDHSGNANLFVGPTWILNKTELAWATGPGSGVVDGTTFSGYKTAKKKMIDGDYDVFGDGTVRILQTPGHTPGHQILLLRLKSGAVILSGDLYHLRSDVAGHIIPPGNTDRAATLASFDRVEKLLKNTHARLIVQHDVKDFQSLPKFPAYLE
jgi:N-acyl homoserine lactone hydrolase